MKRLALIATLFAFPAFAAELEGVKVDDSIKVGEKSLVLNGQGLRVKIFFKVYVASMWLEAKSNDGAAILGADTTRRVQMTMLRDVTKARLEDSIRAGMEKNYVGDVSKLKERLDKMMATFAEVKKGSSLTITYEPGVGTTVEGGSIKFSAEGKDFADALFGCFIGKNPATEDLKKGMLGGK